MWRRSSSGEAPAQPASWRERRQHRGEAQRGRASSGTAAKSRGNLVNLPRAAFESLEVSSIRCPAVPGELGHILDHICVTDQHQCNLAERSRPARVSRESSQVDLQTGFFLIGHRQDGRIISVTIPSKAVDPVGSKSTFTETYHNAFELAKVLWIDATY